MSINKPKSSSNPAPKGAATLSKDGARSAKSTGRVNFDDRGNAVWEWQVTTGAFGLEVSTQRLQKLEHPALSIADEGTQPTAVRPNPLGMKKGYDPYDSGKLGKKPTRPQKTDLRRLSEWLRLKKQAEKNREEEPKK